MRDFPLFPGEYGVSALTLKEIPYQKTAYIRIREVQPGQLRAHLEECVSFCRMAGAEKIYAAGHEDLEGCPLHTAVLEMRGRAWVDEKLLACLFPVTEQTASKWRDYYNRRMAKVDNAQTLEAREEENLVKSGGAYFVHERGRLLGIGWLEDTKLLAMAAEPGAGERVMHTLMSLVEGSAMTLEVASTNRRALNLYERLGFVRIRELSRWYEV